MFLQTQGIFYTPKPRYYYMLNCQKCNYCVLCTLREYSTLFCMELYYKLFTILENHVVNGSSAHVTWVVNTAHWFSLTSIKIFSSTASLKMFLSESLITFRLLNSMETSLHLDTADDSFLINCPSSEGPELALLSHWLLVLSLCC